MKFANPDWQIICKKTLLGGHGKARYTVRLFHSQSYDTMKLICDLQEMPKFLLYSKDVSVNNIHFRIKRWSQGTQTKQG